MSDLSNTARQVGQRFVRLEDARHLGGKGRFVADIRLPGMRDLAFLRSQVAHGVLNGVEIPDGIDPGSVWTADRLSSSVLPVISSLKTPKYRTAPYPILAEGRVRYVGQMIAAVVAPSRAEAEDVVEQLYADIDPLDALADPEAALDPGAVRLHEGWDDNAYMRSTREAGDFEAAKARADVAVTRDLKMARIGATPLETRGVIAHYDRGQKVLTVYLSTQRPHLIRTMLAEQLVGIEESRIRVVAPDVGGGFGGKSNLYPEEIALAAIAMQVPYPVRWIEDRMEHFLSASQSRQHVQRLTMYATREGELLALDAHLLGDGGAYAMRTSTAAIEANMASAILPGPYLLSAYRAEAVTAATNKAPVGPFRGVGRPAAVFAMERMMEETAAAIGMDPVEFRRRNMIPPEAHPYTTLTGLIYDSGDYARLLTAVEARMRASERAPDSPRKLIGVGYGCYTEQTAHGAAEWARRGSAFEYGFESARVRIEPSGDVRVDTGILSHGQGLETTLAQIAGEMLGISYDRVRVRHGDTDLCPYGLGTVASRSLVMAGGAVHGASVKLAGKVRRIAAHVLEVAEEDITLADGMARGGGKELPFTEIAHIAYLGLTRLPREIEPGLEELCNYRPTVETGTWSSGVDAARVEVDLDTGQVKLLDFVVGEDCGFVVNPLIADGQVIGGAAQGIGQALFEELRYDEDGQPQAVTFADYLMPGAAEMPHVDIVHQETLSEFTVFGAKGLGEGGAIAPPAAIANAVTDALRPLGITVTEVPIRPAQLWAAIREAEARIAAETEAKA